MAAQGKVPGFKSCPRVGGISPRRPVFLEVVMFQVVPPCGGHQYEHRFPQRAGKFQVVPPCGGHREPLSGLRPTQVSSRAPVWGASSNCPNLLKNGSHVSSRAPVWGASEIGNRKNGKLPFQVVPPCGGHPAHRSHPLLAKAFQVVPPGGGNIF